MCLTCMCVALKQANLVQTLNYPEIWGYWTYLIRSLSLFKTNHAKDTLSMLRQTPWMLKI